MKALIDSVGWTLLHFVWQGALLGIATALALALLRKARPEHRYNVACAALLACVLWPAAELCLRLQGGNMITAQMRFADALLVNAAGVGAGGLLAWLQAQLLWIVGIWALCAVLLTVRMALGLLWIRRTERTQGSHAQLQATLSRMAVSFGVTRMVRLRVVEHLASPLTAGWWRPLVLVPAALVSGMPPELLEALLAHEMAHVRRLDYLVNLGQNVVEILLFYHPAVWWMSGRIRAERELIADDLAARHMAEPRTLARALSELERMQFSGAQLALAANGGDLLARVKRLVRPESPSLNWKAAIPVLGLAAACLGVFAQASVGRQPLLADQRPRIIFSSCAKPAYPAAALAAQHTGTVTLGFRVDIDGRVIASEVNGSSGHPELDQAARSAIERCVFHPGMQHERPVRAWTQVKYVWTLG
jgi:bla regulator protein BlaR1